MIKNKSKNDLNPSKAIAQSKASNLREKDKNYQITDLDLGQTLPAKKVKKAETVISADKLTEAIIWSEILGKPKCKQRKRR